MKRLFCNLLAASLVAGGLFAQGGSKRVELKEVIDGAFRQSANVGEMRSLPGGEHYTAMNSKR